MHFIIKKSLNELEWKTRKRKWDSAIEKQALKRVNGLLGKRNPLPRSEFFLSELTLFSFEIK